MAGSSKKLEAQLRLLCPTSGEPQKPCDCKPLRADTMTVAPERGTDLACIIYPSDDREPRLAPCATFAKPAPSTIAQAEGSCEHSSL